MEPTLAERARTAVDTASTASLATVDADGRPVVAPAPIVDDGSGQPVTVLSNLTTHAIRARRDARAAMSIADRLLLQGMLEAVPGLQQLELQPRFVERHPHLARQVESLDFSWLRLRVDRVRWTDERRSEHWLRPEDLFGAEPDPLGHLDHTDIADIADRLDDDLLLIVRSLGGRWLARSAVLEGVDRYGITVEVDEPGRRELGRVPFPERLDAAEQLHAALGALRAAARSSPIAAGGSAGVGAATPGSLDGVEGDRRRRSDVQRIDAAGHGDPYPMGTGFDGLGREPGTFAAEDDGDPLILGEIQLGEIDLP